MGEVVRVSQQRSALLHLLTSDTAAGGVHGDMFAPAPASPLIVPYCLDSMREVVERRIRYLQDNEDGGPPRVVTLPDPFIRALLAPRQDSTLPLLTPCPTCRWSPRTARSSSPAAIHAESGIYFTCTEDEARAVVPDDLSDAAVREAYLFLADELFVDVALAGPRPGHGGAGGVPADRP